MTDMSPEAAGSGLGGVSSVGRALPGWCVDLVRDGVDAATMRQRGTRAVYGALLATALSAQRHGWSDIEWETEVLDVPGGLGGQVKARRNRSRSASVRNATPREIRRLMAAAWERAWELRTTDDAWTADDLAAEVESRAQNAADVAADADSDLTTAERDVLAYAASEARRRGLTRIAMPWRTVANATGLGERPTKTALRKLVGRGHLTLFARGRPLDPTGKAHPRANVFGLPTHQVLSHKGVPVNGPMGHSGTRLPPMGHPVPGELPPSYGTPPAGGLAAWVRSAASAADRTSGGAVVIPFRPRREAPGTAAEAREWRTLRAATAITSEPPTEARKASP